MVYFDFARPWALAFLVLLLPLVYWFKTSKAQMSSWRGKLVFAIRLVIVIALIFALADFRLKLPCKDVSVVFVVDSSLSVSRKNSEWAREYINKAIRKKAPGDQVGVVLFGKDAYLEESLSRNPSISRFSSIVNPDYTDISKSIRMASAIFSENSVKRVVLISDGNENLGNSVLEATQAASSGGEIYALPYPESKFSEVLVGNIEAPRVVSENEPFALKVEVDSSKTQKGNLSIFQNNRLIARERVTIPEGRSLFTVLQKVNKSGGYRYRANLEVSDDTFSQNNNNETMVTVSGLPRVLYLTSDSRQKSLIPEALAKYKIRVDAGGLEDLPEDLAGMSLYQAVIFDNVTGLYFSQPRLKMLENYVKNIGGGFIMVGGDKSFGAGGYYDTPVEEILPVSLDIRKRKSYAKVAMVLLIDKSGSMGETEGKFEKIDLAKEAAIATVDFLYSGDELGVIGFDHAAKWVSRLRPLADKQRVRRDIATLRAGGGTDIYPGLNLAYQSLSQSKAALKHVIILSDGRSAPGDFENLIKEMQKQKITVSTVGIGADADIPFLERIAKMGKGRFYYADQATLLPRIFVRETILAGRSPIVEKKFRPKSLSQAEFLTGVEQADFPQLYGYVVTSPKERANLSITAQGDDPLLAYWRVGLGKSVAYTSDSGLRWGKDLTRWSSYDVFWAQMLRWVLPDASSQRFSMNLDIKESRGYVVVEAMDEEGNDLNFLNLVARVISPQGESMDVELTQTAAGRYEGDFSSEEIGTYVVNILERKNGNILSGVRQSVSIPYSPEYKTFGNNLSLLNNIVQAGGGRLIQTEDDVFSRPQNAVYAPRSAWRDLLLLALLLFPLDVALRRVYLPEGWRQKLSGYFSRDKKSVEAVFSESPSRMQTLKTKKAELREKYEKIEDIQDKLKFMSRESSATDKAAAVKSEDESKFSRDLFVKVKPVKVSGEKIAESAEHQNSTADKAPVSELQASSTFARLKRVKKEIKDKNQ